MPLQSRMRYECCLELCGEVIDVAFAGSPVAALTNECSGLSESSQPLSIVVESYHAAARLCHAAF